MSRLTSSFTCQPISVIVTTLIIHYSLSPSLQAQNLQQILPTILLLSVDCLYDNGTEPDLSCFSIHCSSLLCLSRGQATRCRFYCTLKVHVQNCILYFSFVLCSVGNNAATAYRSRLAATANDGLIVSKVFCRIKTSAHKSTIYIQSISQQQGGI